MRNEMYERINARSYRADTDQAKLNAENRKRRIKREARKPKETEAERELELIEFHYGAQFGG